MRVLIVANSGGGLYHFRRELLQNIQTNNAEIYLAFPKNEEYEKLFTDFGFRYIPLNVDRRGINPVKDIKIISALLRITKYVKPDKVITYTIKPNIYGGMVCRWRKISYYANITGIGTAFQKEDWLKKLVTILYKMAFKKVKTVFFENEGNRQIFIDNKIINEERTCALRGAGVNLSHFAVAEYPADEKIRFLFIGRIMKEKGVEELFATMQRLMQEKHEVVLDVVGTYEENYKETVENLEKQGIIKFYGYQKDVRPFIKKAHCFVLPSYHEGMANTLLECGAMGRPLITSNIHGCMEAVVDGETGFLCDVGDAEDLYEKMKQFLQLSQEKKEEMAHKSHLHVAKSFNKQDVVAKTIKKLLE